MGLAYAIAVVSLFDEYVNDLLYLREGSYLPRYIIWNCMFLRIYYKHQGRIMSTFLSTINIMHII